MATDEKKVVWILGAGFSVPLGGPLFRELISPGMWKRLSHWDHFKAHKYYAAIFSDGALTDEDYVSADISANVIQRIYTAGLGTDEADPRRLWTDAEQFLSRIQIAGEEPNDLLATEIKALLEQIKRTGGGPTSTIESFLSSKHGLYRMRLEAIRFVAGACSVFLNRAERDPSRIVDRSEEWEPYRRWADQLIQGQDAVISFNYDRVVDLLEGYRTRRFGRGLFIMPVVDDGHLAAAAPHCVPVYHLHGHVGWQLQADSKTILAQPKAIAHENPAQAIIGVPGDEKLNLPRGHLEGIWNRAMKAISDADAVVFCGYRFPQTDGYAAGCLLDALRKNAKAKVHTVLGIGSKETPRLREMLAMNRPNPGSVVVHDMGCQDLFVARTRGGLF